MPANRKNARPRRQEQVAERGHVLDERDRDRDDVTEHQGPGQELGGLALQDDMESTC